MLKSSHIHFTGDIHVQTMQRQSGIFIGERNTAIGWSAHGKENRVIGSISGQSNLLLHNMLILNDPDIVDTPIDDRDMNLHLEHPDDDHTTNLTLESVNVNAMSHSNSINLGKGYINGMDSNDKVNYSLGNLFGSKNHLKNNVNIVNDQDGVDGIIEDQDIKITNIERD
ncbi:hypothetical protein ACFOU2_19485 [Bacillus songklensis]|uniref:Adhesin domain-containing protein n=1 Tax=Bacillus songklensis TaxID=1069116 RepID=A0ABV8B6N5_9BACI